jgi:uncharacterized protein (TIGR02599 family)
VTRHSQRKAGFSLVELLVATTVLLLICVILVSVIQMVSRTWTSTTAKVEQFREAREGFESITRRLSQAALNTYWDYERDAGGDPTRYIRQSELRFISGPDLAGNGHAVFFQAPLGYATNSTYADLSNLLNTWGYYTELNDDSQTRPAFITQPALKRFRLMEMNEPSENLTLYQYTSGKDGSGNPKNATYTTKQWFETPLADAELSRVVAKNIIALVILPRFADGEKSSSGGSLLTADALAPNYTYDSTATNADPELNSKNQLPPVIQVTMVAIDENSAKRMDDAAQAALQSKVSDLFQTVGSVIDPSLPGYAKDLKTLVAYLVTNTINYRIFTTSIGLKSAKWSREQ